MSYFAEFFKAHLSFPEVIHTEQLSGMPYPVFYGFLAYPLLGLLGAITSPTVAIRIAIAAVFWLQSWQVFRLLLQVSADRISKSRRGCSNFLVNLCAHQPLQSRSSQ